MVILVVDNLGVTVHKAESDTPVRLNRHRPYAFSSTLKLVQMQRRDVHVVYGLRFVKLRKNQAKLFGVYRLDSSSVSGKEKSLQSFVREGFDHENKCNRFIRTTQLIRLRPFQRVQCPASLASCPKSKPTSN
jgi:hypothetical protein